MVYIKNRFSKLAFGFGAELALVSAAAVLALHIGEDTPFIAVFALILLAVTLKIIIESDLK